MGSPENRTTNKDHKFEVISNNHAVEAMTQSPVLRSKVKSRRTNELFLLLRTLMERTVFCFVLSVLVVSVGGHREQKFAIEPQDQSAVVGSRVTLPCRVENKVGQLQWTKDDFGLGTHRHLTGYERYKMIGSDEEGDYSLDIREVTLEDDALYQCQVSSGPRGKRSFFLSFYLEELDGASG
ncbi:hypothetical protein evm_005901 [Chilo suppressalis]|nr:hypothetical protein evm_005901 [Chilo suppressalis]